MMRCVWHLMTYPIVLIVAWIAFCNIWAFLINLSLNSALDLAVHTFYLFVYFSSTILTISIYRRFFIKIIIPFRSFVRLFEKFWGLSKCITSLTLTHATRTPLGWIVREFDSDTLVSLWVIELIVRLVHTQRRRCLAGSLFLVASIYCLSFLSLFYVIFTICVKCLKFLRLEKIRLLQNPLKTFLCKNKGANIELRIFVVEFFYWILAKFDRTSCSYTF